MTREASKENEESAAAETPHRTKRTIPFPQTKIPVPQEPLLQAAEPVPTYSPRQCADQPDPERNAGHGMYNKAALAAYITARCGSAERPVGKVKLMKLVYLIQRKAEVALTEAFVRRAAGPVDDAINAALNLAAKKGWVEVLPKRDRMIPIVPGPDPEPALVQVKKYFGASFAPVDRMVDKMKKWGGPALERWAIIEPLAREMIEAGREPTVAGIKAALAADPVWKKKLHKSFFSDPNIAATLRGLRDFGFLSTLPKGQPAPQESPVPPTPIQHRHRDIQHSTVRDDIPQQILAAMHPGRDYRRADLLNAADITPAQWTSAIRQLKNKGVVLQIGEKRGARYRLNMR